MKTEEGTGLEAAILTHVKTLEALGSRYYASEGNRRAQAYIEACLRDYGYVVERSTAIHEGQAYDSPWALKAGRAGAQKLYLLLAHFDSISEDKDRKILPEAPGADDNATGVAILLETARAFARQDLDQGVGFVFFNAEEIGGVGSKQFAKDWKAQGKRLDGVINIDSIGIWPLPLAQGGKVNYVTNEASRPFLERVLAGLELPVKLADTQWKDDHASFWDEGYAAIELTEEGCPVTMHTPQDTSEKVDVASVTGVAQALIRMFARPF